MREQGLRVHLIDARSSDPIVDDIRAQKLDLNDGMVVRWREQFYYGADAMHLLTALGGRNSFFARLNLLMFSQPRLARMLYPLLVRGRKITLRLLGRKLIGES
ncbi:DUF393 domain-containing protein [Bradyrhizobium sp. RDM12]